MNSENLKETSGRELDSPSKGEKISFRNYSRVMVKVENIDKAVDFCEKVLGAKFFFKQERDPNSPSGMVCAMSTDPGLELLEVISDKGDLSMFQPHPGGKKMFEFIRNHAPGVVGVVIDMDGAEKAKQIAAEMGIEAPFEFNFSQEELDMLGWNYSKYLEYFLDPEKTGNTFVLLSDFKAK